MARIQFSELQRLRQIPAANALIALATYAKRDPTFVPAKSVGTERWHATVGSQLFELVLNGPKFYDTRAKVGGGGAIDLTIHLHHLSFTKAIDLLRKRGNGFLQEVKAFPAEHLDDLLWRGFINPGKDEEPRPWVKYNLRDILITLLCAYGGCRASEPLHLWVDDVFVDPDDPELALVLVHEPSDGIVDYTDPLTGTRRKTSRADFLQRFCGGRKPLTRETGRRHAGWKGGLLTHRERRAFQVFWIDKNAGRLFLTLWRLYIQHVRPVTPQVPWAFLTKDAQPLGVAGFDDSLRAAVHRIGLTPAKWAGTSDHGLRHRYGQWLNDLGLGDKEGQVAMHHLNAKSQEVYRQMGVAKVAAAIGQLSVAALPVFKETV